MMVFSSRHRIPAAVIMATMVASGMLLPATSAYAQGVEGSFQRTLTVGDSPSVEIVSGSGSIEIREGTSGRIEVRGRIRASDWRWIRRTPGVEDRVRQIEAQPPIQQQGNAIRIGYFSTERMSDGISISYDVVVPARTVVRSKTGSGSQRLESVGGDVEVSSGSGSIVVKNSAGRVRASTGSGGIIAEGVGGAFEASTGSGSIEGLGIKGAISARTASGGIEITQTGAGDVEASSSSGSVRLRGVQGGLRASTTSGSLAIQGQPARDWRVSSSSGQVTLDVPSSQGFLLDANSSSGHIDVDVPIAVSGTAGRHALRGTARGGGPLLHVRTSSGGISIQ